MSSEAFTKTVLNCLPNGLCSWDYIITVIDSDTIILTELWALREQGSIAIQADRYEVIHVPFSGEWSLELGGNVVAIAVKPNLLTWFFEVSWHDQTLVLRTDGLFSSSFVIEQDNLTLGTIRKKHAFTKRATVDCSSCIDLGVQVFLFWLAVLMWKRQTSNHNASAGGAAGGGV
ncbi:MAG: hypothetical protein AAF892_14510 [Cyanobacteria bacterium P01_D01_bin.71]